jgi:type IV pilus assembly protein PilQ
MPARRAVVPLLALMLAAPARLTLASAVAPASASMPPRPAMAASDRASASTPSGRTQRTEPAPRQPGESSPRQFTGHPISLDFQDVDLRAVLRTFSEITTLNLVIDPDVKGTVDVSLHEVPWDQAFDIILRANQLDYTVEGTIVRIAPVAVLQKEAEARRKLADEQALSGELVTRTRVLSYAKARDVAPLLTKTALTRRSQIEVDERTNTLIITDLQVGLDRANTLIADLDSPQAQVEIEARIVRMTRDFARELGIRWGFSGQATPELGNTFPLSFPNSVAADATAGSVNTQSADFARLSLGALNGALRIDAALSALESERKVQILLRPRVVTQNNIRASITRGQEIPYTTLAAPVAPGGVNIIQPIPQVQFKMAALTLQVTPRITAANTVVLEVDVDNGSPGAVELNGNRSINTQRVQTMVLVKDQGTTVIGGIYETLETHDEARTPGLSRLPLVGRLFRRNTSDQNEGELLIFITPRILRDGQTAQAAIPSADGAGK